MTDFDTFHVRDGIENPSFAVKRNSQVASSWLGLRERAGDYKQLDYHDSDERERCAFRCLPPEMNAQYKAFAQSRAGLQFAQRRQESHGTTSSAVYWRSQREVP